MLLLTPREVLMSRRFLAALLLAGLVHGSPLLAQARTVQIKFDQAGDCPSIARWDLYAAPITTAQPNPPIPSSPVGNVANVPPLTCGLGVSTNVTTSPLVIGPNRFWLVAVDTQVSPPVQGTSSPLDAPVPLAAPALKTVLP